ncbi:hypothetical protein CSA56_12710 [candidate division KSB3 bacterium]|uniref:Thiamine pyrophosphate-binding protein n=1 Tax=candidate division KSB3 bacterium TaxID=2044937 RepID=A0A2G6KDZ7_9BACT|nr:MAG: hypothetical protein CSA56_12710 [candidate division KSB3 bacterium]
MRGIEAFLEILAAADVRYIFGNPGKTELPLNDALAQDSRFQYILGIHGIPLTAMADGYAMASGELGVVCVHICCGLDNAMGMLYNAYCAGTPLLLLAGQQDRRLRFGESVLAGDMENVARPWTKWSVEINRVEDVPTATRRAIQVAMTPPTGPVSLSIPVDVQLEVAERFDLSPARVPDRHIRPPLKALHKAADMLLRAKNPAILAGSRVAEADAISELVALAEQIGAPVLAESTTSHGRLPMPPAHPLYSGILPLWGTEVKECLQDFDTIFVVGMNLLRLYIYSGSDYPMHEHTRVIHLDIDSWEIGKNYPVELGIIGDLKASLAELVQRLSSISFPDQQEAAQKRHEQYALQRASEHAKILAEMEQQRDLRPITPSTFMGVLANVLPPDSVIIEEAVTTHNNILEKLELLSDPNGHFSHRGWALGWGVGSAIGVKLAWPDRPVIALLGDGASLYGIQGLWTAAHYQLPIIFLIANNTQYKILKVSGNVMDLPQMRQGHYLGMDLVSPEVNVVSLAQSFGVEGCRVTEPDELNERISNALHRKKPLLLDVPIER